MNNNSPASAYQQSAARGASPVGLVVALYDTLLRDFRRALAAQGAAQIETRVFELNHALTVIAHLRSVLDHQRGGEAAARLSRLYDVAHSMILEANISGSRATLLKLVEMFGSVRQAWEHAERQLVSSTTAALRASAPSTPTPPAPPPSSDFDPTLNASGRWSA
jgi:flagellar secretion chaperone FliS